MILKAVATRLLEDATIRDKIAERVYFDRMPGGSDRPAILLNKLSGSALSELAAPQDDSTTLQVDIWIDDGEESYDDLVAIGDRIRDLLEGVEWSVEDYSVRACTLERDNTLAQQPVDGSGTWQRRRSMDLRFLHTNNVDRG